MRKVNEKKLLLILGRTYLARPYEGAAEDSAHAIQLNKNEKLDERYEYVKLHPQSIVWLVEQVNKIVEEND